MRYPAIACALALTTSCFLDPNGPPDGVSTAEFRPFSEEVRPRLSIVSYAKDARTRIVPQDHLRLEQESQEANQAKYGSLSLTLARGTVRPAFCDTLSFQRDSYGAPIAAGADLTAAYENAGIVVGAYERESFAPGLPIAFDSSNPTGNDADLGSPNDRFGGPGRGAGGATNNRALGNVMISAQNDVDANNDGLIDDPNDDASGAWLLFDFAEAKCVSRADIIDIEDAERPAAFRLYGEQEALITEIEAGGLGDNSVEQVALNVCGVRRLKVGLQSSGALHDVTVCNTPEPVTDINFDVDLYNVIAFEFDLTVYLEAGSTSIQVASARTSLDPLSLLQGGSLPPLPIASNVSVPAVNWHMLRVELTNVEKVAHDGSRMPIAGSVVERIAHEFEVRDCGNTHVVAEMVIDARFEGDMLGLGLGLAFENPAHRIDATGCRP